MKTLELNQMEKLSAGDVDCETAAAGSGGMIFVGALLFMSGIGVGAAILVWGGAIYGLVATNDC